jgi:hypothetical protein
MTTIDAARLARTSPENVRAALASGDLRDLRPATVRQWSAGNVAGTVTSSLTRRGDAR